MYDLCSYISSVKTTGFSVLIIKVLTPFIFKHQTNWKPFIWLGLIKLIVLIYNIIVRVGKFLSKKLIVLKLEQLKRATYVSKIIVKYIIIMSDVDT